MPSDLFSVEVNIRNVIRRTEIDEEPSVFLSLIVKRFLVPDRAFVEQQALCLGIPISRHA